MLDIVNVTVTYGRTTVFQDLSLAVGAGEIVGLLGRNGAGKTTLLKCVMGLAVACHGEVLLGGRALTGLPTHAVARKGVGYAAQSSGLFLDLTVSENLRVGASSATLSSIKEELLGEFPVVSSCMERKVRTLSGGEQQQVKFVQALSRSTRLLLLDEISQGVHADVLSRFVSMIKIHVERRQITVLFAEQNWQFAREVGDTLLELVDGRVTLRP